MCPFCGRSLTAATRAVYLPALAVPAEPANMAERNRNQTVPADIQRCQLTKEGELLCIC